MSAFEQKREVPNRAFQYMVVSCRCLESLGDLRSTGRSPRYGLHPYGSWSDAASC
jgi:hypothetical protein